MRRSASAVSVRQLVAEPAPCRPSRLWSRPVSRTPRRCSAARSTSLSTSSARDRADQLQRGLAAGRDGVGHLVDGARRAGRWSRATRTCPSRGSDGASGCAARPPERRRGPTGRARRRSAPRTRRHPRPGRLRVQAAGVPVPVAGDHGYVGASDRGRYARGRRADRWPRRPSAPARCRGPCGRRSRRWARWSGRSPSYRSGRARRRRRRTARAGATKSPADRKPSGSRSVVPAGKPVHPVRA